MAAFVNSDFVTDGKIGISLTTVWDSMSASSPQWPAFPGETVNTTNNGRYIFARAQSEISQYQICVGSTFGDSAAASPILRFVPANTTNAITAGTFGPNILAVAQVNIISSKWGWFQLNGTAGILLATATQPKLPLYLSATDGVLTGTTVTSINFVSGIIASTSCVGGPSVVACIMNNPQILSITVGSLG